MDTQTATKTKPASRAQSRARAAAADQATSTPRELPARPAEASTPETNTAATAAPAAPRPLYVLSAKNPKRNPSKSFGFFNFYYNPEKGDHDGRLTTIEEAISRGVRGKDLTWDIERGHILVEDAVEEYLALKTDDERRAWIMSYVPKGFSHPLGEAGLKMAGLYVPPAPVEQPAAASEAPVENKEPAKTDA